MTFSTSFVGNEHDRSGTATFRVGSIKRDVHFTDVADFHAVAQLLNEARKVEREEAAREFIARAQQWAEGV
jgi:hypothetical protein